MAVYRKLLLSAGGGISAPAQQAEQVQGTATVLVGVGKTGVQCVRAIKTRVFERLRPEDDDAPSYPHIRFLGVDDNGDGGLLPDQRADSDDGLLPLSKEEFLSIENSRILEIARNPVALRMREELSWLEYEDMEILLPPGSGARQADRLRLMDRSAAFLEAVETAVNGARRELKRPKVHIHIFAALSGDAGSGSFLDACYLARKAASRIGGASLWGYFFLPDVALSRIPAGDEWMRKAAMGNGCAAMQELDYCMNLPGNGGAFRQVYQDELSAEWDRPPVDLCHLIGTAENVTAENPYDRAVNTTAEYVLGLLADSPDASREYLLSRIQKAVGAEREMDRGMRTCYCTIGCANAYVPVREINAGLAASLFGRFFQILTNTPTQKEAEALAIRAMARDAHSMTELYESLLGEVLAGVDGSYVPFPGNWESVWSEGDGELSGHYLNQTAGKIYRIRSNASVLMDGDNPRSLIRRVEGVLRAVVSDLERGPVYASRILSPTEIHNLPGLIDNLLMENTSRLNREAEIRNQRQHEFEEAKTAFDRYGRRRYRTAGEKRFQTYETCLRQHQLNRLTMEAYQKLGEALYKLKDQIEDAVEGYYGRLSRVVETLMETFTENQTALAATPLSTAGGAASILTPEEIRVSVETEVERTHISNMLDALMDVFLRNEDMWVEEDEEQIARLVSGFLAGTAFRDFASRTVANILREKYRARYGGRLSDAALHRTIYSDCLEQLAERAGLLFRFNRSLWDEGRTDQMRILSMPPGSACIRAAAGFLQAAGEPWESALSAQVDRISAVYVAAGLPMAAWADCEEYDQVCRASSPAGRYSYESKPVRGMDYSDWRTLPTLLPQSALREETLTPSLSESLRDLRNLYERARSLGVLDETGYLCRPEEEALDRLRSAYAECVACIGEQDTTRLDAAVNNLSRAMSVPMVRTEISLPSGGDRTPIQTRFRILEDYFIASPALHRRVREITDPLDNLIQDAKDLIVRAAREMAKSFRGFGG